jgi:acyl-CoA thioesterase I
MPLIVCLGDSLTSGHGIGSAAAYPAVLRARIREAGFACEVVNAGVSRSTSLDALERLDAALHGDVRLLIVALGANDGLRGVPVAQLKANLTRIIERAQARRIPVLLCAMEALPIYGWDYTVAFHRVYEDLALRYQLPLVPFVMLKVIGHPEMLLPDRVHPNTAGARAIAEAIWPYLEPMIARIC